MQKIASLYSSYQELLLDLDIFGSIVSIGQVSKDNLRKELFEEFKKTHPIATLEDTRYDLSRLVSTDFSIAYNNDIELKENEHLIDLGVVKEDIINEPVDLTKKNLPESVLDKFNFKNNITDSLRKDLIKELDYFSLENKDDYFTDDVDGFETTFNTTEIKKVVLPDSLSGVNTEDMINEIEDSDELDDDEVDDFSSDDTDDLDDEVDDFSSDDTDDTDEDDIDDFSSDDTDYTDDDEVDDFSSDDTDEDEIDDFDSADDYIEFTDTVLDEPKVVIKPKVDKVVEVPKLVLNKQVKAVKEEFVDREQEPKDLREFLRKHPHCETSIVLKYFSRKEVQKALLTNKIIKKGSKLHII